MVRHLHFDCFSGISGDMTLAALLDLGVPEGVVQDGLRSLGLEGELVVSKVRKSGFAATRVVVETPDERAHRHLSHILRILDRGKLTVGAKELATRMFQMLGEAEAASHGIPIEKVHFHEVGAVDSIFDFVGVAVALDWLSAESYSSRPVPTGHGFVNCEHGTLPIPAPAVARLLTGIPLAKSPIASELTTPTGAAVLASLPCSFDDMPALTIEAIGVGAGTRDFAEQPNILRIILGTVNPLPAESSSDTVWLLETNLDDTTPEVIGFCMERLFEAGALDVYATSIQMKKNRPGTLLSVLCPREIVPRAEEILFRETRTFGIRRHALTRTKLERDVCAVPTPWGEVRGKLGWNSSVRFFTPEYEDCAAIARSHGVSLEEVYRQARRGYEKEKG